MFKKFEHKSAIKHEKGDPPRFSDCIKYPVYPHKKSGQNPKDPQTPIANFCASMEFDK